MKINCSIVDSFSQNQGGVHNFKAGVQINYFDQYNNISNELNQNPKLNKQK